MLLYETQPFSDEDYIYELKLDGIRCIAYLGEQKVALGISKEERRIVEVFAKNNRVSKPWFAKYKNAVWLKPELVGTAHFMHETQSGGMRQPVWKGLREDK